MELRIGSGRSHLNKIKDILEKVQDEIREDAEKCYLVRIEDILEKIRDEFRENAEGNPANQPRNGFKMCYFEVRVILEEEIQAGDEERAGRDQSKRRC